MRIVLRLLILLSLLALVGFLVRQSNDSRQLSEQIKQLEAELGKMPISDPTRVYLVEIEKPEIPPEVAMHIERIWQYRIYLPPNYDFVQFSGGGEVTQDGCYMHGGMGSSWQSPNTVGEHRLLTISLQKNSNQLELHYSFGGSSGTRYFGAMKPDEVANGLTVQRLVEAKLGSRSFKADTILPLLKLYDPRTAKSKMVAGKTLTTYEGGLFVFCPKSREAEFRKLIEGDTPVGFDPKSLAKAASNE